MGITPWVIGQVNPSWDIELFRDNGTTVDLTSVAVSQINLFIYNSARIRIGTGVGTFTILSTLGLIQYAPASGDIPGVIGTYFLRIQINFGGTSPYMSDYIPWTIQA